MRDTISRAILGLLLLPAFLQSPAAASVLQGDATNCDGADPSTYSSAACKNSVSFIPLHVLTSDGYSECVYVDNASGNTYFIPFHTQNEWYRFKVAAPGLSLTLRPPIWEIAGTGACSKPCGGGTQMVNWINGCGGTKTTQQGCNTQACPEEELPSICSDTAPAYMAQAYMDATGHCADQAGAMTWNSAYDYYRNQGMTDAQAKQKVREGIFKAVAEYNASNDKEKHEFAYNRNAEVLGKVPGALCDKGADCDTSAPSTFVPADPERQPISAATFSALTGGNTDPSGLAYYNSLIVNGTITRSEAIADINRHVEESRAPACETKVGWTPWAPWGGCAGGGERDQHTAQICDGVTVSSTITDHQTCCNCM